MSTEEQTQFLQQLANDLNTRSVCLPSFPDVVINIRKALEDPACTSERLADVVRTDAVLVARLLMSANSAFHNRAGIEIIDLNLAISRLGFEVVRNTAITLAVEQIFTASEHKELKSALKEIWNTSLALGSMSFVVARSSGQVNPDNAFLCGLLHNIGKLYILTKVRDFPALLGDESSLLALLQQWSASVGQSIVDAWGFPGDIAASVGADSDSGTESAKVSYVDAVQFAKLLIANGDEAIQAPAFTDSAARLNIAEESVPALLEAFKLHLQSMRQSAGG